MTDLSQIHHSVGCVGDSSMFHGKGKKDDFGSVINSGKSLFLLLLLWDKAALVN